MALLINFCKDCGDTRIVRPSPTELIDEMARRIVKTFDDNPSVDILSLAPQDGGGFCQCEDCMALDEKRPPEEAWHARYSRRLAVFNNEVARRVARKHPDKLIKVGAYAMYLRVPLDADYRPEPNLAVQVCHTYSCNSHPIASETCPGNAKYFRKELEHWAKITGHLFIYEYYNKGAWGGLPYYQVHLIRDDIPYYQSLGAEGFYTQPAGARWPACGLNHYVAAKLTWDVDLDVDRLLDDFYEKFYAEAAANPSCVDHKDMFEQFVRDAKKNEALALCTRRESVTEMILEPITGLGDLITLPLQEDGEGRPHGRFVIHHQDVTVGSLLRHPSSSCRGREMVKRVQERASLATWINPPCASTILLAMESPNPVPFRFSV